MQVKHLDHLNLTVSNFAETVDWYKRVFGFQLVEEGNKNGLHWGIIKGGESMLCIYEYPQKEFPSDDDPQFQKFHGLNHFGLRITDRNTWEDTISRENIHINYGGPVTWPTSTSWYVNDPTGYEIEVALWNNDQIAFSNNVPSAVNKLSY